MQLMEKDVHEKQETVISLRKQLDDIKSINLEMYKKLQVGYYSIINNLSLLQSVFCIHVVHLTIDFHAILLPNY